MCINPGELRNGQKIGCRTCWQCRSQRKNDWVGRCIAESKTSAATHAVTLTYGRSLRMYADDVVNNPKAQTLTYPDVQLYLKRLRHNTDGLRFFVTGEYGQSGTMRAHWHMIAFWKKAPPPNLKLYQRYMHWAETPEQAQANGSRYSTGKPLWDEGWSYWNTANEADIRYVAKYLLKDVGEAGENQLKRFGLSSQPPLGAVYFRDMAKRYVAQSLSPQTLEYRFDDVFMRDGKTRRSFWLRGRSARNFLDYFVQEWRAQHGNEKWPYSALLSRHVMDMYDRELAATVKAKRLPPLPQEIIDEEFRWYLSDKPGRWIGHLAGRTGSHRPVAWAQADQQAHLEQEYLEQSKGW